MTNSILASSEARIELAADRIDLAEWIENLSDREYQACSPAHIAAGSFRENGVIGSVNVESVGGHLLVHHYLADEATAGRVVMHSQDTRVYVMHTFPATIEVIWTLELEPADSRTALFRCTVEVRAPLFLAMAARLGLLALFLRRHVAGETPLFARDMARKVGEGTQ